MEPLFQEDRELLLQTCLEVAWTSCLLEDLLSQLLLQLPSVSRHFGMGGAAPAGVYLHPSMSGSLLLKREGVRDLAPGHQEQHHPFEEMTFSNKAMQAMQDLVSS